MSVVSKVILLALLTVAACGMPEEPETQLPNNEELIQLFIDMHLAEVPMSRVPLSMRDSIGYELRRRVAKDHGMTAEEMQEVIHSVQTNIELATEIYDSVEVRLNRMQKREGLGKE